MVQCCCAEQAVQRLCSVQKVPCAPSQPAYTSPCHVRGHGIANDATLASSVATAIAAASRTKAITQARSRHLRPRRYFRGYASSGRLVAARLQSSRRPTHAVQAIHQRTSHPAAAAAAVAATG
jgi:hypothetical protein